MIVNQYESGPEIFRSKIYFQKMFKETLIILCIVASAWSCVPWDGNNNNGTLFAAFDPDWQGSRWELFSERRRCEQIPQGARSVRSGSVQYECRIYASFNCDGPQENWTDRQGWTITPFVVFSFSCPWRCF